MWNIRCEAECSIRKYVATFRTVIEYDLNIHIEFLYDNI